MVSHLPALNPVLFDKAMINLPEVWPCISHGISTCTLPSCFHGQYHTWHTNTWRTALTKHVTSKRCRLCFSLWRICQKVNNFVYCFCTNENVMEMVVLCVTRLVASEITGRTSMSFNGEGRHSRKTPPLILHYKNFRLMLATAANCCWFIFLFVLVG